MVDDIPYDTNFLSQPAGSMIGQMLAEDPVWKQPDTASLVNPEITTAPSGQPLDTTLAKDRAGRYSFATTNVDQKMYGSTDPSTFYGDLINGDDQKLREKYGMIDASMHDNYNYDKVQQTLATKLPGEGVTDDDLLTIRALSQPTPSRPSDVFERMYADRAMATATSQPKQDASHVLLEASDENPTAAQISLEFAKKAITRQQYAQKKLEELETRRTAGGKVVDFAISAIPFANSIIQHNAFSIAGGTSWLPGNNMEESQAYYYNLPEGEYTQALDNAVDAMEKNSPTQAADFLKSLIMYGSDDKFWGNMSVATDIALSLPYVTMGKMLRPLAKLGKLGQATAKATQAGNVTADVALSEMGEVVEAGIKGARESAARAEGAVPALNTMQGIDGEAQRVFQPTASLGAPSASQSAALRNGVETMLHEGSRALQEDVMRNALNIDRLTGSSLQAAADEADQLFRLQNPYANDHILDTRVANKELNGGINVDHLEVILGRNTKDYFDDFGEAANFAKERMGLDEKDAVIRQLGDNKFAVVAYKPLNETSPFVRSELELQTKNATPVSNVNRFLGWLRGSQDTLSKEAVEDRVVATFGSSQLAKLAKTLYAPVGDLGRRDYKQFVKYLSHERDITNPLSGRRGEYSKDIGDFQRRWESYHGSPPSEKQIKAYFAHTQMSDIDWVMRNVRVYIAKARKGCENFLVNYGGATEMKIEGRFVQNFDWDAAANAQIAIIDEDTASRIGSIKTTDWIKSSKYMPSDQKKTMKELIESGEAKLIQPTREGLDRFWNAPELDLAKDQPHVDYFLVSNMKTRPLDLRQIPYRPGGHVEYTNGSWFLRQAKVELGGSSTSRVRMYKGDTTVLAFDTEAKARKWLPKYEEARAIYAEVKDGLRPEKDLADYVSKNLPDSLKAFKELFNPKGNVGLKLDQPLRITPKGKSIHDMDNLSLQYKDNIPFVDVMDNPHSMFTREDTVKFTGERDNPLLTIRERGTPDQPLIDFRPATLLDPVSVMDRAASSLMRGRYLDDVKLKYAEYFTAEFGDVLENNFRENIRDPFHALVDAKFKTDYPDQARLAAAKNYRQSMVNFLGLRNEETKTFDWLRQQLADSIYTRGGDEQLDLVSPYLLHRETDPVRFWKQFAFHAKLGMFNPKQIFVQGQAVASTAAIEGLERATKGVGAGILQMGLQFTSDEAILKAAAQKALGWKPEQFIEATKALKRSGFMNVGREVQLTDGFASARLRNSKWGKFLDWGTAPFSAGEQISRTTAWNASYLNWRAANPAKTMADTDIKWILNRANILTQNMSAANAAAWQYGLKSIPTQFWSYRARLCEQLLGKSLTPAERWRLFGMNALLYGLPVGVTAAVPGLPINDWVKETANYYGHNIDDNMVEKFVHDGLASSVIQAISGFDTDVETSYGPGPITQPYDLIMQRKGLLEVMGGASGTVFGDLIGGFIPFFSSVGASLYDHEWPTERLTTQDVLDLASTISTVNQAKQAIYLTNFGKYYTKNQAELVGVDPSAVMGIMQGVFGLGLQEKADVHILMNNIDARKAVVKDQSNEAIKYFRLAWEALEKKDGETANKYFGRAKKAMDWGDLTFQERAEVTQRAMDNSRSVMDSINWKWAQTDDARLKALQRKREGKE